MPLKSVLLSFLLVGACSQANAPQPRTTAAPAGTGSASSAAETSSATSCSHDEDCYCRVFNGAGFQEGREASKCCTQESGCPDAMGAKVAANHCMTCVYD
ncbi:MAG TPA: hypothetical protein VLB44_12420 [Kofleriaceae bacterium]|nr:hypothetical protein [Kofleriaceae bacterium]